MPKLRMAERENQRLYELLKGRDVTTAKLSMALKVCHNTALKKLRNPGTLTVDDLKSISKAFGIPYDEIREAIFK